MRARLLAPDLLWPILLGPILLGPTLLAGCTDAQALLADAAAVPAAPTWTEHIQPLYEARCVRCHTEDGRMDAGVALDDWTAARSTRVRSTCVSVGTDVIDLFGDALLPLGGSTDAAPCAPWEALSMPPGAMPHLTLAEQLTLARWAEQGGVE